MTHLTVTQGAFQQHLNEGRLMATRCQGCGALHLPPRPHCPHCHGEEMAWEALSGRGRLAAFAAIHIGLSAMIAAGYDRARPYCSGIVQLEEGPAVSAQIVGVDPSHPEAITIGLPLRATFIERGADQKRQSYLAFEPAEEGLTTGGSGHPGP
jgi:uncharacterized OB-fold protein